jgi:hypothetical protein
VFAFLRLLNRLETWLEISEQYNSTHPITPTTPTSFREMHGPGEFLPRGYLQRLFLCICYCFPHPYAETEHLWRSRCPEDSRDTSAVSIATGYGLDDQQVRVRVPVGSRIFSSTHRPDRLWCLPSLLSNGYRGSFPRGKVARAWSWPLSSNAAIWYVVTFWRNQ